MDSLHSYLGSLKGRLLACPLVVIGNEAADLDSMVSAVTYGYLLTQLNPSQPVLPLITIHRQDFFLRREAVYLFQKASIRAADLIFLDDLDLEACLEGAHLILVDHNRLKNSLRHHSSKVRAIIDHHQDEGLYPVAGPRIIKTIGSNATLIAQEFWRAGVEVAHDLAVLFAGTILLDTINFDLAAKKTTAADRKVVAAMLSLCGISGQDLFEKLQRERLNIDGLSSRDLLRKDYKEYQFGRIRCGVAAVSLSFGAWQSRGGDLRGPLTAYQGERSLDLLLVMSLSQKPALRRELLICWQTEEGVSRLVVFLQKSGLELSPLEGLGGGDAPKDGLWSYGQGNLGVSRKKLQPLLASFFE